MQAVVVEVVAGGKRVLLENNFLSLEYLWWWVLVVTAVVVAVAAGKPVTRLFLLTWPMQLTLGEEGSSAAAGFGRWWLFRFMSLIDNLQKIGKKGMFFRWKMWWR